MNSQQRLNLQKIISQNDIEETTDKIRELKHSKHIYQDVATMIKLKKDYSRLEKSNREQFKSMCQKQCSFIYTNYTNIFNKLFNDYLDVNVLYQFIKVLERIENKELDQHDGSYEVGTLLKKLYVDGAIKEDKIKESKRKKKVPKRPPPKNISWAEYKKTLE